MDEMLKTTTLNAREHFKVAHALDKARATLGNAADLVERVGDRETATALRTSVEDLRDAGHLLNERMHSTGSSPYPVVVSRGRQTSDQLVDNAAAALAEAAGEPRKTA